jgi:KaiC/GvpD/RAD55 family RecA-like ATPase
LDLENPDLDVSDAQYNWDQDFQRHIIALLMVDKQFLVQSMDLIKPTYFTNKAHQKVCDMVFEFFKKYKDLPRQTFIQQEMHDVFKDDKAKLAHLGEVNTLFTFFEPGLEAREYLADKITYFAKIQAIKIAFNQSIKWIDKNPESEDTWTKVYEKLRLAMNVDRNFDEGLKYFQTYRERYERMALEEDITEKFILGYPSVDMEIKGGGYNRGEMLSIIAGSGVGKSLCLTHISVVNVLRDKKVCYISFELSEDRVAERFDSMLTGTNIHCLYNQKENVFKSLELMIEDKKDKNLIVIKTFPGKTADANTVRAYLTQLRYYGFEPDIVVFDYIGEMKDNPDMQVHESREQLVGALRGLANEGKKFFGCTAMQPNRGSKEAQKISRIEEEHLADSFGQIRPLDGAISINQNDSEKLANVARGWVMKQRFGKSRYQFYLKFDPATLKFTEISHDEYKNRLANRTEKISDEVAIDKVVKEYVPSDARNGDTE